MASFGQDLVGSLTGNIQKAVIEIVDGRDLTDISRESPVAANSTSSLGVFGGLPINSDSLAMDALGGTLSNIRTSLPDLADVTTVSNQSLLNSLTSKQFTVQFNPSELRLRGVGGGMIQKTDFSTGGDKELSFSSMDTRITMDVTLIFDKVNPKDAFMFDKFTLSETGVLTGAAQAIMKAAGALDYSVQPEVEGLIAALRNPLTRQIFFYWGNMCYTGILNSVSSNYTMFNVSGQPIRATVDLSIVCAEQDGDAISRVGYWDKAYDNAFTSGDMSLAGAAQKVGSLLNFSL